MPITQVLNSKANVKKTTNQDLPFSPAQPVIARYSATSTAAQTVINLSFSVDTTFTDTFFLFIDGKKFTIGASNDFAFSAIGSDGTSSQVTLNQPISSNLNIEAFKLGLKKESEFQTDNRFVTAYDYLDQAFQGFVSQSTVRTATATAGTPAAGTFYSSISNRAPMVDLSQDLKARMGIDRLMTQSVFRIANEFGPSDEPIWTNPNDSLGQVRFIGSWSTQVDNAGQRAYSITVGDAVEVTFYGTGLTLLTYPFASFAVNVSVDGGSSSSVALSASIATITGLRNYSSNTLMSLVSGLTLGIHTVKMTMTAGQFNCFGFEILNESSSVKVQPGISYASAKKLVLGSQSVFAYNAPVSGSTGGRVLVYHKSDGTIGQSFTQNAVSSTLYNGAVSHANEELVKTISIREFGAGRTDDLSASFSTAARAFTLDDGTTTLKISNGTSAIQGGGFDGFTLTDSNTATITFVGTGIDLFFVGDGGVPSSNTNANAFQIAVDGNAAVNMPQTSTSAVKAGQWYRVASGLPYGTHTVRFIRNVANSFSYYLSSINIYQPKKPILPAGAVELADYNVMANYVANATMGGNATGVLRKFGVREFTYTGTWNALSSDTTFLGGFNINSTTAGATYRYVFFGTGFEIKYYENTAANFTISVDGSTNLSGFNTSLVYTGTGLTFTPSTGVVSGTPSSTGLSGGTIQVSNLALGLHTLVVTLNSGQFYSDAVDIITPIHSYKSNLYSDLQNSLPVGSQGISDNRKFTPVKDLLPATKAWAQAVGIQNSSITSTVYVPMVDMSVTVKTSGGSLEVVYSGNQQMNTSATFTNTAIFIDGVQVSPNRMSQSGSGDVNLCVTIHGVFPVAPGVHKVDIYWRVPGGQTVSAINDTNSGRTLTVKET